MLEGTKITAGGREWTVPEMRVGTARKWLPYVSGEKTFPEDPAAMLELMSGTVASILRPNYPDMSVEEMEDAFAPSEYLKIISASAKAAGLVPKGEAIQESKPGTGDSSEPE